jgi:hypothetical protein
MNSTVTPIVNLDDYRATREIDSVTQVAQATVQEIVTLPDRQSGEVSFSKFYPLGEPESGVAGAITLLREGLERIEQAITLCQEHDAIGCDDCLQQVVALLPELFVLGQSAGDGFSAVVLATFHCVKNVSGPCSERQLLELRSGLKKLLHAPYMDFEAALDIQEAYEGVGLDPDSKEINKFSEFIVKQGESVC